MAQVRSLIEHLAKRTLFLLFFAHERPAKGKQARTRGLERVLNAEDVFLRLSIGFGIAICILEQDVLLTLERFNSQREQKVAHLF